MVWVRAVQSKALTKENRHHQLRQVEAAIKEITREEVVQTILNRQSLKFHLIFHPRSLQLWTRKNLLYRFRCSSSMQRKTRSTRKENREELEPRCSSRKHLENHQHQAFLMALTDLKDQDHPKLNLQRNRQDKGRQRTTSFRVATPLWIKVEQEASISISEGAHPLQCHK